MSLISTVHRSLQSCVYTERHDKDDSKGGPDTSFRQGIIDRESGDGGGSSFSRLKKQLYARRKYEGKEREQPENVDGGCLSYICCVAQFTFSMLDLVVC